MPTISDLTTGEFKNLLDDYFVEDKERRKLTEAEVRDLAERLNKKIDVPILNETGEEKIIIKIVLKIDRFLYDNLPNEFYDLIRSLDQGIDDDEARRLIKRLAKLANEKIDIPYLPEPVEYIAIRFLLALIINAARKKWDMARAAKEAEKMKVPNNKKVTGRALEALVPA